MWSGVWSLIGAWNVGVVIMVPETISKKVEAYVITSFYGTPCKSYCTSVSTACIITLVQYDLMPYLEILCHSTTRAFQWHSTARAFQ